MGRKKIAIRKINDARRRQVTFTRRKFGLMKKAYELSILCNCDVGLVLITKNDKLYAYSNKKMDELLLRYTDITETGEECEILDNRGMVSMIERSKEGLDDYFGGDAMLSDGDDQQQVQEDVDEDSSKRKGRKRQKLGGAGGLVGGGDEHSDQHQQQQPYSSYYFAHPPPSGAQGYPQSYMPYPYYMYAPMQQPAGAHDKSLPNSAQSSSYHLPPPPFAFAQNLHGGEGATSQTLLPGIQQQPAQPSQEGLPSTGSNSSIHGGAMFAGGMYYPFGAPWPPLSTLPASGSMQDVKAASAKEEQVESVDRKDGSVQEEVKRSMADEKKDA